MNQYRLKKDMPDYKAGTIFTMDDNGRMTANSNTRFLFKNSINNFDDWFEDLGEKLYRRQQISYVNLNEMPNEIDCKALRISFHMLKTFLYEDSDWGIESLIKGGFHWVDISEYDSIEEIAETINYLNQLVSDGYIEIQDNPNIVWEGENE